LQLTGLWVIGGSGVDTERSLHFNYSHQLSRKSDREFSDKLLNQLFQEISHPISNTTFRRRRRRRAATIIVEPPPSSWSRHHC
jgi:hypothetical protein